MKRSVSRNDAGRATRPWHQPACKASTHFIRGTEFFAIVQLQSSRSAWRTAAPAHQACNCTCGTCSMRYAANRRHDMGAIIRHGMSCDAGSAVPALLSRCGMDALVRSPDASRARKCASTARATCVTRRKQQRPGNASNDNARAICVHVQLRRCAQTKPCIAKQGLALDGSAQRQGGSPVADAILVTCICLTCTSMCMPGYVSVPALVVH